MQVTLSCFKAFEVLKQSYSCLPPCWFEAVSQLQMLSQDADIRELIREWNISRNLQNVIRNKTDVTIIIRCEKRVARIRKRTYDVNRCMDRLD